ncbi:glutathione s-transferase, partial [Nannochloropsis gaditana CCMP526]|uniref:glutathione s-transferase n=1 Tax=Nannochloropsis gaditana (strain CCMP526) TaxID=1093141 RepID=UPI00029F5E86
LQAQQCFGFGVECVPLVGPQPPRFYHHAFVETLPFVDRLANLNRLAYHPSIYFQQGQESCPRDVVYPFGLLTIGKQIDALQGVGHTLFFQRHPNRS